MGKPAVRPTKPTSIDEWIAKAKPVSTEAGPKCTSCKTPFKEKIDEVLEAMIRHKAHHIRRRDIFNKLKEDCPAYPLTFFGLEKHLIHCVRAMWDKAKGRA